MAWLAMLGALLIGWIVVRLLLPPQLGVPGLFRWLMEISLGAGLGFGITSCFYFLLLSAGLASRFSVLGCELAALAGVAVLFLRRRRAAADVPRTAQPSFRWIWVLRAAAILASCTFALDFGEGTTTNPNGEYDAVTIWNLRARYLAAGVNTWHYAVSGQMAAGMTGASHPGYPLLSSAFVARTWLLAGETSTAVPATLSLAFTLAALGLLYGASAAAGAEGSGLLAILVLFATEAFVSQAASQYADIPLSFYILATMALLAAASLRPWHTGLVVLAGLCAGFAAWTKNEGLPFALVACLVAFWRGGARTGAWMALGIAPGAVLTALLKFWLATGEEKMFPHTASEALVMIASPSRWLEIAASFARNVWELGVPWAHPMLLLAVSAVAFGFVSKQDTRARLWLLLPPAGLVAADFGIYLISTTGLGWQLSTSNNRLIVQVWPALLFVFFLILRPPSSLPPAPAPAAKRGSEKKRRVAPRVAS